MNENLWCRLQKTFMTKSWNISQKRHVKYKNAYFNFASSRPKNALENRIDMFEMVFQIKQRFEFFIGQFGFDIRV